MNNQYVLYLLNAATRDIIKLVNEILDRLEYEGSIIFQEYPDKNQLQRYIQQIFDSPSVSSQEDKNYLYELIEAIFVYEMLNRRARYFDITNTLNNVPSDEVQNPLSQTM